MQNVGFEPLNKNRNKCIGCVYPCVDEHGDGNGQEFDEMRHTIYLVILVEVQ